MLQIYDYFQNTVNDNGKISTSLSDKWTLPTGQIVKQVSAETFELSENGNILLDNASFEDIVANARHILDK